MIYWYADFPLNRLASPITPSSSNADWSAIEKVVNEISSTNEFPMTEDENTCRFCSYRSYCERGSQPGSLKEAEAELESVHRLMSI